LVSPTDRRTALAEIRHQVITTILSRRQRYTPDERHIGCVLRRDAHSEPRALTAKAIAAEFDPDQSGFAPSGNNIGISIREAEMNRRSGPHVAPQAGIIENDREIGGIRTDAAPNPVMPQASPPSESLCAFRTSRRAFIKGVIASGSTVAAMSYMFRSGFGVTPAMAAPGTVERLVTLKVNGQLRRVDVLPNETLAMTLRYKLGLTGTKLGCDRGECGACSVMLDGVTHYSCTTLTHSVAGRDVTTIEGIAGTDGKLHPVQQAFIDELAPQCGFCTPGQVVAAVALLRANPKPTLEEAKLAMSGNLCRCGAYEYYLRGVMRAAREA